MEDLGRENMVVEVQAVIGECCRLWMDPEMTLRAIDLE
jgi:hypothetical protein